VLAGLVNSCRKCSSCQKGQEQYCSRQVPTYNSGAPDSFGGYSQSIVVDQDFVVSVPASLDLARAAPLLCAGITTYSAIKHFASKDCKAVGVMGFGGLGHMAIKFSKAMGYKTYVISTSKSKEEKARALGADEFILSSDPKSTAKARNKLDLIINTISANHDVDAAMRYLRTDGKMVLVGLLPEPIKVRTGVYLFKRLTLAGSAIGGIAETQEMLNFCADKGISADIDIIPPSKANFAMAELAANSSSSSRFVIDIKNATPNDWTTVSDVRIDPRKWKVRAKVIPPTANIHSKL
jgi:uncharacterized zinc-type alcohol dehydrogenase-like protein